MELYEKIIVASAMGIYLCFIIYQNRFYFIKKHQNETQDNEQDDKDFETIIIETEDESGASIEIKFKKDGKDKDDKQ